MRRCFSTTPLARAISLLLIVPVVMGTALARSATPGPRAAVWVAATGASECCPGCKTHPKPVHSDTCHVDTGDPSSPCDAGGCGEHCQRGCCTSHVRTAFLAPEIAGLLPRPAVRF